MIEMKNDLEEILIKEERSWRQKVKMKWAKEGDNNTQVFYRVVNGQRRRNAVNKIELEIGEIERWSS